jgi:glycosyltransferase involved in cell wall biosynthesis
MKISIITVVYNGAATIASAVASVLAQDHPDVEYIVIDGGSKDATVEILKSYGDKIAVLVSEPDKGIYDAMNKGVARATGDVVGILNADDYYADSQVLSAVARHIQAAGTDALIGDLTFVKPERLDRVVRYYGSKNFGLHRFERGDMPPHPTFFVKRAVYERLGNFDTQYRMCADYDLMLRFLYLHKVSYTYLPKVMVTMRMGGITNQGLRSKLQVNREIMHSMRKNGLPTSVWRVYSKYFTKVFQLFGLNQNSQNSQNFQNF